MLEFDNKKALLIDDDSVANAYNKFIVKSLNHYDEIVDLASAKETIHYLKQLIVNKESLPGIILIDLNMPEMGGFELADEIDELFTENGIVEMPAFIILSSSFYKGDYEKFEANPIFKKFLQKPLKKEALANVINGFLCSI